MNKKQKQRSWPLRLVAIITGCVALFAALDCRVHDVPLNQLENAFQFYGIETGKVSVEGSGGEFRLFAKQSIRKGETLFSVPRHLCITPEDTAESDAGRGASVVDEQIEAIFANGGSSSSFKQIFLYGFYLLLERRNPLSSFQEWFQVTPHFNRQSGALYWDESDLKCVDDSTKWEARAMRTGLLASVDAAVLVCHENPLLCPEGLPSVEEMRWGLSMYFHFNIRDQAIVPFVTFARFGSRNFGVDVVMNRKHGGLDVRSNSDLQVGNEILNYFPRGPSSQLAARGTFDSASLGVEASIDLKPAMMSPQGKKVCADHVHELMFGVNGRPRDALLTCFAWIIATPLQRQTFKDYRADKTLMKQVYSGLYEVANNAKNRLPQECRCDDEALRVTFSNFEAFTRRTLQMNLDHLSDLIARM